jgi:hypothetical protein
MSITRNIEGINEAGANLNIDLSNNVDTTDNNIFADTTISPVEKKKEAAQNFLESKKSFLLNKHK